MIKFYPIVFTILGFALPGGENPSVIAALGASGSPSYGGINPTKLEDGGKDNKVSQLAFAPPPRRFFSGSSAQTTGILVLCHVH